MPESELARLRRRIAEEYQAATRALTDLAVTAPHAFITARMENLERCRQRLHVLVGEQESTRLFHETIGDL